MMHKDTDINKEETVLKLLRLGRSIETNTKMEPLCRAIEQGDLNTLKAILEEGIDVNQPFGDTALCLAIKVGELNIVQALLEHGANPNQKPAFRKTPIQTAITLNNGFNIFVALLNYGAKLQQINILKDISPAEESSYLSILYALPPSELPLSELIKFAKTIYDAKITAQEIINIVEPVFPSTLRENFDHTFKQVYQNALKIRAIDRYARENGFLNLQALPAKSSSSLTKEAAIQLPDYLSESITSFTLELSLPATRMLFEIFKENIDKPHLMYPKTIQKLFFRKATTHVNNHINELIDAKTAETQKLASRAQAKIEEKQAQEERISTKAETLINRTIEEAKKREQEQAKEEREGKDTLEKFKTKPIEKKDLTSSTSKEDRSR